MKISNFLIFKNSLFLILAISIIFLLLATFFNLKEFTLILKVTILLSFLSFSLLFRKFNEIVIDKEGIYFYTRSFFYSFSNSQERSFISFSYLNDCKIIHGFPIIFSLKYFKSDGAFCIKHLMFFIDKKKAVEFECLLNQKIWGV